jgi:SAM-dependent methyltransferase
MNLQNCVRPARCYVCGCSKTRKVLSLTVRDWAKSFSILRCGSCRLEFLWPLPEWQQTARLYDERYYEAGYLAHERERRAQFRSLLSQLAQRGASGPLLDVGAGPGLLVALAKEQGWAAEGIEISPAACRIARRRYGVELRQGEITEVSPGPRFGVVVLWQVVAHTLDPAAILSSAAAALRPGGLLVMSFVNWRDPHYRLGKLMARWKGVNAIHVPTILWHFEAGHLRALAQRAGLAVDTLEYAPRSVQPRCGWKRRVLEACFKAYRKTTRTGEEIHVWCRPGTTGKAENQPTSANQTQYGAGSRSGDAAAVVAKILDGAA